MSKISSICKSCNIIFEYLPSRSTGNFCSNFCSQEDNRKKQREKFFEGNLISRAALRRHLEDINGRKCVICNGTEWMGLSIPLEVDHIDGNAANNRSDNVRLLCPNCHAQTPTHAAKNKGNGRASRGLKW